MGKTWLTLLTALLLLIAALLVAILLMMAKWRPSEAPVETETAAETATVVQVVDGDTSRLEGGRRLRYLGINAPERGDPHAQEATLANRRLVEDKSVRLEFGGSRQGQHGRLLAYVFVDDTLVNETLLRQGHAHLSPPIPRQYRERLCQAQEEARTAEHGIWARSAAWGAIRIAAVHADAEGDDRQNLNDEFIVIENQSQRPVDFNGWTVSDAANHRELFSHFTLAPKAKVTLRTGLGVPSEHELFWGSRTPIWNNKGDAIFIRDTRGNLVSSHAYGNASCRTNP